MKGVIRPKWLSCGTRERESSKGRDPTTLRDRLRARINLSGMGRRSCEMGATVASRLEAAE